jgi:hypothetical protein
MYGIYSGLIQKNAADGRKNGFDVLNFGGDSGKNRYKGGYFLHLTR